jgi:hypothetical protein
MMHAMNGTDSALGFFGEAPVEARGMPREEVLARSPAPVRLVR